MSNLLLQPNLEVMKIINKRKIDIDDIDSKDVQWDIVANLIERVPRLKNERRADVHQNLFGLIEEVPVYTGFADPKEIIKKFGKNRKVSKKAVAHFKKIITNQEMDPVLISKNEFIDGGHRVAAYAQLNRKIPVIDIYTLITLDWDKWLNGEEVVFKY